jgi:hypothetical protein
VFDWLFEGRLSVYVLLVVAAAALVYLWVKTRKRHWLLAALFVGLLAGFYFLLDRMVETDREQIERKVLEMAAAVRAKDIDGIFRHVSDNFRSASGKTKKDLRDMANSYVRTGEVREIVVWQFAFPDTPSRERKSCNVSFLVKFHGNLGKAGDFFYRCQAVFDFDPQNGWRLKGFDLFDPMRENEKIPLPF